MLLYLRVAACLRLQIKNIACGAVVLRRLLACNQLCFARRDTACALVPLKPVKLKIEPRTKLKRKRSFSVGLKKRRYTALLPAVALVRLAFCQSTLQTVKTAHNLKL